LLKGAEGLVIVGEGCVVEGCVVEGCVVEGCVVEGCVVNGKLEGEVTRLEVDEGCDVDELVLEEVPDAWVVEVVVEVVV
jgi:hypothetical protein